MADSRPMHAALGDALATLRPLPFLQPHPPVDGDAVRDPGRRRLVLLRDEIASGLREGAAVPALPRLRTEAYRLASCSWEDPWAYGMVAWSEEATAESLRLGLLQADPYDPLWREPWSAWRTAWWIRRAQGAPADVLAQGDLVMGILHARLRRWDDARGRLSAALERLGPTAPTAAHALWHAMAVGDAF